MFFTVLHPEIQPSLTFVITFNHLCNRRHTQNSDMEVAFISSTAAGSQEKNFFGLCFTAKET